MSSVRTAAAAALFAGTALAAGLAQAQVYRVIGPDGKVTFTDRPPVEGKAAAAPSAPTAGGAPSTLPAEVRKAAGQYPVTLYAGSDCAPCDTARGLLQRRGIPFAEKTISTAQDVAALQRLSGAISLPFATVGGQHLSGFSESEWSRYLDAAGYPKTSQLPASYRNPPATPMVAVQQLPPAATEQANGAPAQVAAPQPAPAPSEASQTANPAGIRF
jgi:glutaredoxin